MNATFANRSKSRDTCSSKGQLEKMRNWKVFCWKVRDEIGKNEVGKL